MEKKSSDKVSMIVFITKDFDLKLRKHILDLAENGIHKTKADRMAELAQIGLLNETK